MTQPGREITRDANRPAQCNDVHVLRLVLVASALLALALPAARAADPVGSKATLAIASHSGIVRLSVEVARTPQQRDRGLKFRRSLGRDAGMVFVFGRPTSASFWMKDTLIPLSVAFYDGAGRVVRILDMAPCERDPCRLYTPGFAYRGAVEVNRGAFTRLHVRVGDVVSLRRP
jgi:uncharacterized protein